jgi:hypothetical protein
MEDVLLSMRLSPARVAAPRPMLFADNREWNDGMPVVECLCLAPFSPKLEIIRPELIDAIKSQPERLIWGFPMTTNADAWGLFVQWKLSRPSPEEDEEDK